MPPRTTSDEIAKLAERLAVDGREVWNPYGPPEAPVVACAAPLDGRSAVSIGLPLPGWDLAVVDKQGCPVGLGEVRQLGERHGRAVGAHAEGAQPLLEVARDPGAASPLALEQVAHLEGQRAEDLLVVDLHHPISTS